jgi:dolichol-phosphate mannosyltransferase
MTASIELSVVVPVYGCAPCLRALHERLADTLAGVTDRYEIVFVDDRSADGGWDVIVELAELDPRVRGVRLSRNFGQHAAITAGLARSRGRWTVVMDCDLQDRPENIPRLWEKAQAGYDVVYARRTRRRQPWFRRLAANLYFRTFNALTGARFDTNFTNLSIVSRKVVDAFLTLGDKDRHYLLIVDWLGFESTTIEVEPDERHAGRSAYSLKTLLRVALDGLFFQSAGLLRWSVYVGLAFATVGGAFALVVLARWIVGSSPGDAAVVSAIVLAVGGMVLAAVGVAALYVGKIFDQVKGRPLFVVDSTAGGARASAPAAGEVAHDPTALPS